MINPISFDRSWIEAEKRAFDIVVEATQSRVNYDAFLGHDRGVVNAWYFASDSLQDIGESVLLADNVPTIGIPYYAECM